MPGPVLGAGTAGNKTDIVSVLGKLGVWDGERWGEAMIISLTSVTRRHLPRVAIC